MYSRNQGHILNWIPEKDCNIFGGESFKQRTFWQTTQIGIESKQLTLIQTGVVVTCCTDKKAAGSKTWP